MKNRQATSQAIRIVDYIGIKANAEHTIYRNSTGWQLAIPWHVAYDDVSGFDTTMKNRNAAF